MNLRNLITYATPFMVKFLLLGLIHEMGHLLTLLILGHTAELKLAWYGLFTVNPWLNPFEAILVASGGLLAVFAGNFMINEETGDDRLEWRVSCFVMLAYSVFEIGYFVVVYPLLV